MIYAYVRISTGKQEFLSQKFGIETYCKEKGVVPDEWICEQASGGKKASDRELGALLNKMQEGDLLVTTEISRLGRSTLNVMSVLNDCMNRGLRVWAIKGEYCLDDNLQSKLLAFVFSIAAEIERDLIRSRTRETIARKKAEGKSWGRPEGFRLSVEKHKLFDRSEAIFEARRMGKNYSQIAAEFNVDKRTVQKFIENQVI